MDVRQPAVVENQEPGRLRIRSQAVDQQPGCGSGVRQPACGGEVGVRLWPKAPLPTCGHFLSLSTCFKDFFLLLNLLVKNILKASLARVVHWSLLVCARTTLCDLVLCPLKVPLSAIFVLTMCKKCVQSSSPKCPVASSVKEGLQPACVPDAAFFKMVSKSKCCLKCAT